MKFVFEIFRKFVEKFQALLQHNKNDGYSARRSIYVYHYISLTSS